jgi:hypothetical protein
MLDQAQQSIDRTDEKRRTFMGTVQLRPNDHWDFLADGFYSKLNLLAPSYDDLMRFGIGLKPGGPVVPGSIVLDQRTGNSSPVGDNGSSVNMIESGEFQGVDERGDGRVELRNGDLTSLSLGSDCDACGPGRSAEVGMRRRHKSFSHARADLYRGGTFWPRAEVRFCGYGTSARARQGDRPHAQQEKASVHRFTRSLPPAALLAV